MSAEQTQVLPPGPISIDLNLNNMIQRVDTNVTQEIIVITADKARLCLMRTLDRLERRRSWVAPFGILATLLVVFPTTTFHDSMRLSKDHWMTIFVLATMASLVWFVVSLFRLSKVLTIEDVVKQLRTDALPLPETQVSEAHDSAATK